MTAERRLLWIQRMATAMALACVLAAFLFPLMLAAAACAFTWQATVAWCRRRNLLDGRNVWENA